MTENIVFTSVGEIFSVRLESIPTTAYIWEVGSLPAGLLSLGSDYDTPEGAERPGDRRVHVFHFQALKNGEHVISFVLKRRWENTVADYYSITVRVN